MFLAGDSILRLKDSGELKVLTRISRGCGDRKNKSGRLEWGVKLRSWRAETDHDSGVCKAAGGLSTVMSNTTRVFLQRVSGTALSAYFTGYLRGCGVNLDKAWVHRLTGAMCC